MNVYELAATLTLKDDGYQDGLDDAEQKANETTSKTGKALTSLGAVAKKAALAAGAAVVAMTTLSVNEGSKLEQSIGGVETLFKSSADKVIANANKAWSTAGMSANEYMENVTSFSASLLQSLGGDTNKAADYADRAMQDMSDNSNKMGTDMERITDAYQGFAKDNYTMLDNLNILGALVA